MGRDTVVKIRIMPKEEAQMTRRPKQPGVRRARMNEFDTYVLELKNNPDEAVVFEEIEENPQKFVLSLRGAFKRAGMDTVVVRKMRGRGEVRAWVGEPG